MSLGLAFLVIAQDFLVPLVLAALTWFIINAVSELFARIRIGGKALPRWLCLGMALVVMLALISGSAGIIVGSIDGMVAAAPQYEENFHHLVEKGLATFGLHQVPTFEELAGKLNFGELLGNLGTALSGLAGNTFLIILYLVFMLLEQNTFPKKWRAMFGDEASRDRSRKTLAKVTASIRNYVALKTGINLVTALLAFILFKVIGLDFPVFWAFLVFVINYIPTLGSMVAVSMPSLFALLQFEQWTPILVVLIGMTALQTIMLNIVEPRFLGQRLNISGLVVILSLVLWGSVWGIVGMVLSVPIMVSLMIVMAEYPTTRPVAIWLSNDGDVAQED